MKCPFCRSRMSAHSYDIYTTFICLDESCLNDDMPRYQVVYKNYPTMLWSKTYMLDKYYIQTDFIENITKISVLDVVILLDTIIVPHAINLDLKDIDSAARKIRKLMIFS